ncbi:hypothetical protein [Orbus mooreae]|uniref:hypothetical protein n=1 Tax=Orbus mooreae TaxID=3074107 RepID=UPI00370DA2ED
MFSYDFYLYHRGDICLFFWRGSVVHRIIKSLKEQQNEIYEERSKSIDDKIQQLKSEVELLNSDFLQNIDELDALYICLINGNDLYRNIVLINNINITNKNIVETVKLLKENKYKAIGYGGIEFDLNVNFVELNKNQEYLKRKKIVTSNQEKKQHDLREQIKALEKEKTQINLPKNIAEVIDRAQDNGTKLDVLLEQHIKKEESLAEQYAKEYFKLSSSCYFPLLQYFIREGYIDEHYSDYMTFFNSNGLSSDDVQFLRNIKERAKNEWDLELRKPALVLQTLNTDSSMILAKILDSARLYKCVI